MMHAKPQHRDDDNELLDAAYDYLERGWQPVPIPRRKKAPIKQGWQNLKVTRSNLERHFDDTTGNIGVRLGQSSGGLTDIDLDCSEAIALADSVLPKTDAEFGRKSKRAAHRLYITNLADTEQRAVIKYQEPKALGGAVLVELRIGAGDKGAQTLFPPSRHPEGELIKWDKDGKPNRVKGTDLKQAVATLAAACLLARHYPGEGSRHDAALVLGGVLARGQWSAKDIAAFVKAVAETAGDAEARERGQSASGAVDKLKQGKNMPGLPRLREVWGEAVADTTAKWLDIVIPDAPIDLDGRIVLPHDEPLVCAREFVNYAFKTADGRLSLQYYRGAFYRWIDTHYVEADGKDVRSKLYQFLDGAATYRDRTLQPFKPNSAKVNSILDALEAGVIQSRDNNAPFWLEGATQRADPEKLIACRNGLLDIVTRELQPHTPMLFSVNALPYAFDPDAPTYPKRWMAFLQQLWPDKYDGKQSRFALQEFFGLMLTPNTRFQKIFLVVGPKRSGKGTIARILTALLGKDNVANPTLASLSTQFGLAPLIDKRVAIISDARLGPQTNAHTVAERLLSISGEDGLTIDRKYRDAWTGRLGARFLILSNELPGIADASGALPSRFVVLVLSESFYGHEDLELTDKLMPELPGILNWSLRGLDRLRERGHFKMPRASVEVIRQLEDLASPEGAFIREWCLLGPNEKIGVKVLFSAFKQWCEQEGHKIGSSVMFGRNLRAVVPQLKVQGRNPKRSYVGINLSEYGGEKYDDASHGRS